MTDTTGGGGGDLAEIRTMIHEGHTQGQYHVALLGLRVYEPLPLYRVVKRGLSYSAFEHLQRNTELSVTALADFAQIAQRTLARRKEQGRLEPEESDRLLRASRVFARALALFEGDVDAARTWLSEKQSALGGMVPLVLAASGVGAHEVEQLIGRLEHGLPA